VVAYGLGSEVKNNVNIVDVGVNTLGRLYRMTKTVRAVFLKAVELDADIYHLHDPELMPIWATVNHQRETCYFRYA